MRLKSFFKINIVILLSILLSSCASFKPTGLYDIPAPPDMRANVNGFYSVSVFSDYVTDEIWHTESPSCISVENVFSGQQDGVGALKIKWDRPGGGCKWIGMGIGWDNWAPKDLHAIINSAAVQFWVRNTKGSSKGLPWAVCLEDYNGAQAWTGITPNNITGGTVSEDWTMVTIPLSAFDFITNDADMYSIKQMLIQFESAGEVMIDNIEIVPFKGSIKNQAQVAYTQVAPIIDGIINAGEWPLQSMQTENAIISITSDENNLYISAVVKDNDPLNNIQQDENIWNGDALEIAFSTNTTADANRTRYLFTDKHLGIKLNEQPIVWDWTAKKQLNNTTVHTKKTETGYNIEASIPWKEINTSPWTPGNIYGVEVGIDDGSSAGARKFQYRWNNSYTEGFNINPSLWGEMIIKISE